MLEFVTADEWSTYVLGPLKETKERDRELLGGIRPTAPPHGMGVGIAGGFGNAEEGEGAGMISAARTEAFRSMEDDDDELDASGMPSKMSGTATSNEQVGAGVYIYFWYLDHDYS